MVIRHQGSDGIGPHLARQTQAELGIGNSPAEEQIDRSFKKVVILQEKRPPLGEADFKAPVDRHLRIVGLHLAEIRIDGNIERKTVTEHELRVQPHVRFGIIGHKTWKIIIPCIQAAKRPEEPERNHLKVPAGRDILQADQRGSLINTAVDPRGDPGPKR